MILPLTVTSYMYYFCRWDYHIYVYTTHLSQYLWGILHIFQCTMCIHIFLFINESILQPLLFVNHIKYVIFSYTSFHRKKKEKWCFILYNKSIVKLLLPWCFHVSVKGGGKAIDDIWRARKIKEKELLRGRKQWIMMIILHHYKTTRSLIINLRTGTAGLLNQFSWTGNFLEGNAWVIGILLKSEVNKTLD